MNGDELAANPAASERVVHDLNADPTLPFADDSFDAAVCCVSVDYLVRPIEVFREVRRVLRPGGPFVCTFSNRLFPTKAIRGGWPPTTRSTAPSSPTYFRRAGGWSDPVAELRTPLAQPGDPLYAVYARRAVSRPSSRRRRPGPGRRRRRPSRRAAPTMTTTAGRAPRPKARDHCRGQGDGPRQPGGDDPIVDPKVMATATS